MPANAFQHDPFFTWLRDAYDPDSPEAQASVARALDAQRHERAAVLEMMLGISDPRVFMRTFLEFFQEDPAILTYLTVQCAARGAVLEYRNRAS